MADQLSPEQHLPMHTRQRERLAQRGWRARDRAMQRPSSYPHPAGRIRRIETHISVVYLAGRYAYKVKNASIRILWISPAPMCVSGPAITSSD